MNLIKLSFDWLLVIPVADIVDRALTSMKAWLFLHC